MDFLTVPEVAQILGLSKGRVRELCQAGRLGQKIGRQWLFTREEVEAFKHLPRHAGRPRKEETS